MRGELVIMRWIRESLQDFGLLFIRLVVGVVFVFHGSQKLFGLFDGLGLANFTAFLNDLQVPYPEYAAVSAAAVEFLGGLSLITGRWVRTMGICLAGTMATAIGLVHPTSFSAQHNGMEYPLTLVAVAFGLSCTGAGRFVLVGLPKCPILRVPRIVSASGKKVEPVADSSSPAISPGSIASAGPLPDQSFDFSQKATPSGSV